MEKDKVDQEGECCLPKFGIQIELVNMPKVEHPTPSFDVHKFVDESLAAGLGNLARGFGRGFGREFGFKIQPKEYTPEEKVELLKKQKKFFEEKALKIGEHLKELEKPLKKEKKKPLEKVKKPLEKEKKKGAKK